MTYAVKVDGWYVKLSEGNLSLVNNLKEAYTTTSRDSAAYVAGRFMAEHADLVMNSSTVVDIAEVQNESK